MKKLKEIPSKAIIMLTVTLLTLIYCCGKETIKPIVEPTKKTKYSIYGTATANGRLMLADTVADEGRNTLVVIYLNRFDTVKVFACGDNPKIAIFKNDTLTNSISGSTGCVGTTIINR